MLTIAIVDDESVFTDTLNDKMTKLLINTEIEYKIYKYNNPLVFFNDTNSITFDIAFLDIDMKEIDGITLAKELSIDYRRKEVAIIFLTSHEERVFDAFGANIIGFISKFNLEVELKDKLLSTIEYIQNSKGILLKSEEGNIIVSKCQIYYFNLENRKIYLYTYNKRIRIYYKILNDVYSLLDENFIFVNRSCIINLRNIKNYTSNGIILNDSNFVRLEISRGRTSEVSSKIIDYYTRKGNAK